MRNIDDHFGVGRVMAGDSIVVASRDHGSASNVFDDHGMAWGVCHVSRNAHVAVAFERIWETTFSIDFHGIVCMRRCRGIYGVYRRNPRQRRLNSLAMFACLVVAAR